MISFEEAYQKIIEEKRDFGTEYVALKDSNGRVLAEDVHADRDFPPFNRATKDGIAIRYESYKAGRKEFGIEKTVTAGAPVAVLKDPEHCVEIMTGAVVPYDSDTVIMYEELKIDQQVARVEGVPKRGQNIHYKGSDIPKGAVVLQAGKKIGPAEIGVLASVGKSKVLVRSLPRTAVISTGNELVDVAVIPEPHQVRRSNTHSIYSSLAMEGITPLLLHLPDDVDIIRQKLGYVIQEMDVVILSGGVSKGKTDHIPRILEELGVQKIFHRVAQKPGKPFLFGKADESQGATLVFSFPGNPVSTFANYHLYFRPWFNANYGLAEGHFQVAANTPLRNDGDLTQFKLGKLEFKEGRIHAKPVLMNGSGDLNSLTGADGFIELPPKTNVNKESLLRFFPCRVSCP